MQSCQILLGHCHHRLLRGQLNRRTPSLHVSVAMTVEIFAYGSVPLFDVYVVATNATLFLYTGLQTHAPPEIVDTHLQRVKIFTGEKIWRCAKIKPAKILHYVPAIDLAKFFPCENFPLCGSTFIQYVVLHAIITGLAPINSAQKCASHT